MALKGAILGDIAGSRYEFYNDVDWKNTELFTDTCYFTDDTVMSLSVKKALIEGTDYIKTMQELGNKYPDAGYGGHFSEWLREENPQPYNSYGNGAAMRVSFIADYYENLADVKEAARQSAEISHNHPEGIKGAETTAVCIWMAKHGKTKDEIYRYMMSQYPASEYVYSGKDLQWLREKGFYDISCQGSVPVALRCFYESDNFESFMRNIFSIKCDRDTIGAIGGGTVEEYYHGFEFDAEAVLERFLDAYLLGILRQEYEQGKFHIKPIPKQENTDVNNEAEYNAEYQIAQKPEFIQKGSVFDKLKGFFCRR